MTNSGCLVESDPRAATPAANYIGLAIFVAFLHTLPHRSGLAGRKTGAKLN